MKRSKVPFVQLQRLLEKMGFVGSRDDKGWRFEHPPSNTIFLFRPYRPRDKVYEHHLFVVRLQLHGRGLMEEDAFDESLAEMPAAKRMVSMLKTYTANYTKTSSGYMGQLIEWPEVITEGKTLEDCRESLQDALREMIAAYRQQQREIPLGGALIEQIPVEV